MIKFKYCAPSITYTYSNTDADNLVFVALKNNATRSDDGPVLYARGQKMEFVNSVWKTWVNTVASDMEEIEETVAEALTDFDTRLTSAETSISGKQATLVSGTNIKTVNNTSLLGSGNISIVGGGDTNVIETVKVNGTALTPDANKAVDIDISGKEDALVITSASGTSLSAEVGKYYYFSSNVSSLTITLPTVTGTQAKGFIVGFATGSIPSVTISSAEVTAISFADGYNIEGNTRYELNFLWNGSCWNLSYVKLESLQYIGGSSGGGND